MSALRRVIRGIAAGALALGLALPAWAGGGDVSAPWPFRETIAGTKQVCKAAAVDASGNIVLTGSTDGSGSGTGDDLYTIKVKADGTGKMWTAAALNKTGNDAGKAVVVDALGNAIVAGYVWSGTDYDFYTAKYKAADGTVLWSHTYDGGFKKDDVATAVALDTAGNVYVAGVSAAASGKDDFLVVKYDGATGPGGDGKPLWVARYDAKAQEGFATEGHDQPTSIAVGASGIAVIGASQRNGGDFDILTVLFNTSGQVLRKWRYVNAAGDDKAAKVRFDAAGNVYSAGSVLVGTTYDIFVAKYDPASGTQVWAKTSGRALSDEAADLWVDTQGGVFVAGYVSPDAASTDLYVERRNQSDGVATWTGGGTSVNSFNGNREAAVSLFVDEAGEVYATGPAYVDAVSNYDIFTVKLAKATGDVLWQKLWPGGGDALEDQPVYVALGVNHQVVVAGHSQISGTDYDLMVLSHDPGLLNAPTNLVAKVISTTQVDLTWNDNSSNPNEDKFVLERKTGELGTWAAVTGASALASGTVSFSDTTVVANQRYYYRVKGMKGVDSSLTSNEATARTTLITYDAPAWTFTYDNAAWHGEDEATGIGVGPDNNPVVTGFTSTQTEGFNIYTAKLNHEANGVPTWSHEYNDVGDSQNEGKAVAVDGLSRAIVAGYTAPSTVDIFTLGYPATPPVTQPSWNDPYDGAGGDDWAEAIAAAVDGSNNVAVVGYGAPPVGNDDVYVIKYAWGGTKLWPVKAKWGGTGIDQPKGVAFDAAGNVVVAGFTDIGSGNYDYFVLKYPSAGTADGLPSWAKTYGDGTAKKTDKATAVAVDAAGNVYATGWVTRTDDTKDVCTVKYLANGTPAGGLWPVCYDNPVTHGDDVGAGVAVDPIDGDIVVAGTTTVGTGNRDFLLLRYAPDGTLRTGWPKILDRPTDDELVALAVDAQGYINVTGKALQGGNWEVVTARYRWDGEFVRATEYNSGGDDVPVALAVNRHGEAFAAGYKANTGARTDHDYLVVTTPGETLAEPSPLVATPYYTDVVLTWSNNSLSQDGVTLQRKLGACSAAGTWSPLQTLTAGEVTYTDSTVSIGQTYCYQAQAYKGANTSRPGLLVEATTVSPTNLPPVITSAQAVTRNSVQVTWAAPTTGQDGFTIQRCEGGNCTTPAPWPVAATPTNTTDTSVCAGHVYTYQVNAFRTGKWTTVYSTPPAAVSPALKGVSPPPSAPTLSKVSDTQVGLSWTAAPNDGEEQGYQVWRCTGGVGCSDFGTLPVATVLAGVTTATDTVAYGQSYTYKVTPYKNATCPWPAAYSPPSTIDMALYPPALSATAVNTTQINLAWTPNTFGQTSFDIEKCQGASCQVINQGAAVRVYADTAVCPGTTYTYRIKAKAAWDTGYTGYQTVTTGTPVAPSAFSAAGQTEGDILLTWTDNTPDRTDFSLLSCLDPGGGCTPASPVSTSVAGQVVMHFDEASWRSASYNDVIDSASGGRHGYANNGAQSAPGGKYGWAAKLNASTGQFIRIPAAVLAPVPNTLTVSVWAKSDTATWNAMGCLVSVRDSYIMHPVAGSKQMQFYVFVNGAWAAASYTPTFDITQWHHYVGTYDGTTVKLYMDGLPVGTTSAPGTIAAGPYDLNLGRDTGNNTYFGGMIDEFGLYFRTWSDAEILALYNTRATVIPRTFSGYAAGTTYKFQIQANKTATCSTGWPVSTGVASATTLTPQPPNSFNASAVNTTEVDLTWGLPTTSQSAVRLERCSGTYNECVVALTKTFDWFQTLAPTALNYFDTSVCSGTNYTYRVRAEKTTAPAWGSPTAWTYVPASTGAPNLTTPSVSAVAGLTVTADTESQMRVAWSPTTTDHTVFVVEKCLGTLTTCTNTPVFSPVGTLTSANVAAGTNFAFGGVAPAGSPVIAFGMEEASWNGTAGEVKDSSGNGNNGTAQGGSKPTTVAGGKSGRAGGFDGTDDYVLMTYAKGVPTNNFTLEAWVKPTATVAANTQATSGTPGTGGQKYLFGPDYNADPASGAGFSVGTNGVQVFEHSGGYMPPLAVYNGSIPSTSWTHVVVTYTNRQPRIYVNGALVTTGLASPKTTVYAPTQLGGMGYGYFAGQADSAVIYDRALSAAEVLANYQNSWKTNVTEAGLTLGSDYTYRVRPDKTGVGCAWPVLWVTGAGSTPQPPPPTNMGVTTPNTNQANVYWTLGTSTQTRVVLQRCTGDNATCTAGTQVQQDARFTPWNQNLAANAASYPDATVAAGAIYTYRVRAEKATAPTWNTAWTFATVTMGTPTAPAITGATRADERDVSLVWNAPNADHTGFELCRCATSACASCAVTYPLAAGTTTYTDGPLAPNAVYYYQVRDVKTGATGAWPSAWSTPPTAAPATTVINPASLAAAVVDSTTVRLAWNAPTLSDSETLVERNDGTGWTTLASALPRRLAGTLSSYVDTTACSAKTYSYRIMPVNRGLARGGAGTWTKKAKINFTTFPANTTVELTVPKRTGSPGMKTDFEDVRFFDMKAMRSLPYWIKSEAIDKSSAVMQVKTGPTNDVWLFYGNADAGVTSASDPLGVLEFYDDFGGSTIDAARWNEYDTWGGYNVIDQQNDLVFHDRGTPSGYWQFSVNSVPTFNRVEGKELYFRLTTGIDSPSVNNMELGWLRSSEYNTTSPYYLLDALFLNNYGLTGMGWWQTVYGTGTPGYAASTDYEAKITLHSPVGAALAVKGGAYATWTTIFDNGQSGDTPLVIALMNDTHEARIHEVRVTYASTTSGAAVGTEVAAAAADYTASVGPPSLVLTWTGTYVTSGSVTTGTPKAPTSVIATAETDKRVVVTWTPDASTTDQTGFYVYRCNTQTQTCTNTWTIPPPYDSANFTRLTAAATARSYPDDGLTASYDYVYRVSAYKTAPGSCNGGWETTYAPQGAPATDKTYPAAPQILSATALNSKTIKVTWKDNSSDATGFELEVLTWNGKYANVATLAAGVTTYTDTEGIDPGKTYTYRIRAVRTIGNETNKSPYSTPPVSATTPALVAGDTPCEPPP